MGYIKDEHLILTCYNKEPLEKIRIWFLNQLKKEALEYDFRFDNYLSPILKSLANTFYILFIPADGSKEGWEISNILEEIREKLLIEIDFNNSSNSEFRNKIFGLIITQEENNKPNAEKISED